MKKSHSLKNKKILITGGSGFLGKHLAFQLRRVFRQVYVYKKDVRQIDAFARRFDIVCHLAALNKINSQNSENLLLDVNVNGTLAVMRYCCRTGAKCIFASSSAVYKPTTGIKKLHENSSVGPASFYGLSKMLAENICENYAENFGVSTIVFRIFNIYGPGQKTPFLIPYIASQLTNGKHIMLKEPESIMDFVYITDVVRAFISACLKQHKGFRS